MNPSSWPRSWLRFWQTPWPDLLVLAVAALTRFWRLDYHSIWFDEAVSLRWAGADPAYTWQKTFQLVEEKHPPLYYLALHFWQTLLEPFGLAQDDGALRALGSLLGVATVLGILLLASRLSGRGIGRLAGLLVALSPVLVWYSQELRMFQPATAAIVWAAYSLLRAWQASRRRLWWWLGFVACLEAALYTYLFSAFVLPAAGLTLLLLGWQSRDRRRLVEGVGALGLASLLFLPLARNAWLVNAAEGEPGRAFADFAHNLRRLLQIFTVWRVEWPQPLLLAALILLAGLVLVGLAWPRAQGTGDRLWLLCWIGVPLLIANVLLSRSSSIFAEDRYLIFLAPFVLWAAARGGAILARRWPAAGWPVLAATVLLLAAALPPLWTPARYRENWRAAARYILQYQTASPGLPAAVVTHVDYTHDALEWYLRQRMHFDELPVFFPWGGRLEPDDVETVIAPPLQGLVDFGAATLWLTQSHLAGVDDQRLVEGWLNQHFPRITEQYPAGIKLSGYALRSHFPELPALAPTARHPDLALAPNLMLAACEVTTPVLRARDDEMHPPSGWVHVRLWWQARGPIAGDYTATAQVVGPEGVWGEGLPNEGSALRLWPTSTWPAESTFVRDELDINLNPATPPGEYGVTVGLQDGQGERGPVMAECGRVTIED
ncbi:glycosyltransferase family 39 protein [Litorilinea aerophila]|uniref:Glycosyltransferase RgtA/B/C/D-like domain-containing protein n=1 Tax=Litorilinea aerophila TaxID=1204385 RepID=A0A540VC45_9CHLR|nr:glycosyltransferase family 39 protein [Litorilinea aerophila]MCC9077905.1 glycosyltransferase family 39 protein [Litorilinea aerophila]